VRKKSEDGFVLVPAVWLSGLIAVALSAFLVAIKIDVRAAANLVENAKAEFLADGMVRVAAYVISTSGEIDSFGDGHAMRCSADGAHTVTLSVQDQAGLVDLNAASLNTVRALGEALGLDPEAARALADRIADFRDSDDDVLPAGAEEREYHEAGASLPPKNAPFQDIGELDQVLGMSDELRKRLAKFVTIHSEQDGVDPTVAPPELTSASGMTHGSSQRTAFAIEALISARGGGRFHRHAIIKVLRRTERPFAIVDWSRGSAAAASALQSAIPTECGLPFSDGKGPDH
jgi:general secretion pathway protein K